jgi:hypothetical protein
MVSGLSTSEPSATPDAALGKLDDVLTEAAVWLRGLAQRWDRKLKERKGDLSRAFLLLNFSTRAAIASTCHRPESTSVG